MLSKENRLWPTPRSHEVALFTDLTLYAEALELAVTQGTITVSSLQRGLGQRLQKMRLVLRQSPRTVERLMRELRAFGWIEPQSGTKTGITSALHVITLEGHDILNLARNQPRIFHRRLIIKMQEIYVIPGWFIARLWQINPKGQGEVILPAPTAEWKPTPRSWDDHSWDTTLQAQTMHVAKMAREVSVNAFPIRDQDWLTTVQASWYRLSTLKPRQPIEKGAISYSPRERLALAMREASVGLLFNKVPYGVDVPDFSGNRPPIYLRTFMGWCPRLESLELIFYSDWHPWISGRLLFPVSVFRLSAPESRFEMVQEVHDPNGNLLWLHQPQWETVRTSFFRTLIQVHQRIATKTGTIYISLLDVRDEICRQLRISSFCFDRFLELTLAELPTEDFPWSIAVETDTLEEHRGGSSQLRHPAYLNRVPHTLIGLARLPQKSQERKTI